MCNQTVSELGPDRRHDSAVHTEEEKHTDQVAETGSVGIGQAG